MAGSPHWTAPEVIDQKKTYSFRANVWSLGITIIKTKETGPPYSAEEPLKALYLIYMNSTPRIRNATFWSKELKVMLSYMLCVDLKWRNTISEVLKQPFLETACGKEELMWLLLNGDQGPQGMA